MNPSEFQQRILEWFDLQGRKDLPWQQNITPYRVWLSETMLQQTQVSTVIPYFNTFMQHYPSIELLAQAPIDDVLHHWSGLGYYARARNLHKTAQIIATQGYFPDTLEELNKSHPILDGNVKRVLARFKAISGWSGHSVVNKQLWGISAELTPEYRVAEYTQAMMDLGATVCTRSKPNCSQCPIQTDCLAKQTETVSILPTPKPPKRLPVKQLVLLLLSDSAGQILLEKRPPTGIWGGLWSLPEFNTIELAYHWCLTNNQPIIEVQTLAPQRHTFSHYHLDYTTVLIKAENPINFVMEANQTVWYKLDQLKKLGLPAPIKLLLQQHARG